MGTTAGKKCLRHGRSGCLNPKCMEARGVKMEEVLAVPEKPTDDEPETLSVQSSDFSHLSENFKP